MSAQGLSADLGWGGCAQGSRTKASCCNPQPSSSGLLAPLFNSMKEVNTESRLWRETFLCGDVPWTSAVWTGGN